VCFIELQ